MVGTGESEAAAVESNVEDLTGLTLADLRANKNIILERMVDDLLAELGRPFLLVEARYIPYADGGWYPEPREQLLAADKPRRKRRAAGPANEVDSGDGDVGTTGSGVDRSPDSLDPENAGDGVADGAEAFPGDGDGGSVTEPASET